MVSLKKTLAFAQTHERALGAGLFAFGFLTDLLTFTLLPIETINLFFVGYLSLAVLGVLGAHGMTVFRARDAWWKRTLVVVFPLLVQYAIGGILSGFVVFYAKNSVLSVSWPFLLLIASVYAGNEYFRKHKEHLLFQTTLFFFALYAYAIFAVPLFFGSIGPLIFLGSTVLALVGFGMLLLLLSWVHRARLLVSIRRIVGVVGSTAAMVVLAYFTGLIPPLPLVLVDEGVFHSVRHVSGDYLVTAEMDAPWWHLGTKRVHVAPGEALSVVSAVRAPISFSTTLVHRWEYYDESQSAWVTQGTVSFPMNGGRAAGYRGYSTKENPAEGSWRVSVETKNGQTIGRSVFNVEAVASPVETKERVF